MSAERATCAWSVHKRPSWGRYGRLQWLVCGPPGHSTCQLRRGATRRRRHQRNSVSSPCLPSRAARAWRARPWRAWKSKESSRLPTTDSDGTLARHDWILLLIDRLAHEPSLDRGWEMHGGWLIRRFRQYSMHLTQNSGTVMETLAGMRLFAE